MALLSFSTLTSFHAHRYNIQSLVICFYLCGLRKCLVSITDYYYIIDSIEAERIEIKSFSPVLGFFLFKMIKKLFDMAKY